MVNVEGSGTRGRTLVPTSQGILTHTNHYLHPEMQAIEGKGDMRSTTLREQRSCQMMSAMAGQHTVATFQQVLRDHTGYPDSICRHSDDTITGFSVICEAERRVLWFGKGFPCQATYIPVRY